MITGISWVWFVVPVAAILWYLTVYRTFETIKTRIVPLPSVLKGIVFGLVVWYANYLGWLPIVGMAEAATKQPIHRNALMIAAHGVWGAVTGVVTNGLHQKVGELLFRVG